MFRKVPYKWLVAITFVAGFFMDLVDATIVNVALPTLARELNAPNTTLEWVVTGYLLSLAIWIPASGWIGDRYGTKPTFLFALGMFAFSSALCSLAPSSGWLIVFRVLQGVGGGMMTPVGFAMLFRAFPANERAQAASILSIPVAVAPALGPVIGGWLVDYVGWRWIFLVNVPIGIGAFLFGLKVLKDYKSPFPGEFDVPGFLLSGIGLVLALYSLSAVPTQGITLLTVLTGNIGLGLLVLLVWVELRSESPILRLRLFKDRIFRSANLVIFFGFALWIGSLFVLPLFLQQLVGLSAFYSGLTTAPQALGWIAMATVSSRFYKWLKPRKMVTIGLAGVSAMTLAFVFVDTGTSLWAMRALLFVRGLSMAFAVIPIQAAAYSNIPKEETGRASSIINTNRQVASSVGVAILGMALFQFLKTGVSPAGQLSAYHAAFAAAAALGLVSIYFASRIHDEDAAASLAK